MNICADILSNINTDPGLLDTMTLKGTRFENVEATLLGNPKDKIDNNEKSGIYEISCKNCDQKN
ncbi:hypothetical protein NQ318_009635 [Aromia moschata]|uniref:Uncharacterized protein n=1 Tax=Aromia moschata TaxID=1265417 RepID=A0AAV8Y9E7_9CUCU|nr:hypothetical protein NQ318_009635 [Aromia moschata]